jgi:hypothetical protein
MELCHTERKLDRAASQRIMEFMQQRRRQFGVEEHDFEGFERELHELVMALECELVAKELIRYDVSAPEIEVGGKVYEVGDQSPETYLAGAGLVTVKRHLYHAKEGISKSICPLEVRVGVIGGYFTP